MAIRQSIPDVGMDLESHTRVLKALKEAVELGQGSTREVLDSFITFRRAVDAGLFDTLQGLVVDRKPIYANLLLNSPWVAFGGAANVPGFYRDALGRVFLRGLVASGTNATTIATLPAGFRPQATNLYSCVGSVGTEQAVRVDVTAAGAIITLSTAGTFLYLSLDGISFEAFQ